MSVVLAEIDIAAPPEEVWGLVMDPGRTLEWVTIARRIGHVDEGPLREGFRMDQTLCLRGVNFKVRWTLEEVEAPHFARWEGRGPARSKAVIENRLKVVNGGTHFDYRNEFKSPLGPLVKINADYTSLLKPAADGSVARDDRLTNYSPSFKVTLLTQALSYISRFTGKRCVLKMGKAALSKDSLRQAFCEDVNLLKSVGMVPIVVHGEAPGASATPSCARCWSPAAPTSSW